MTEYYPDKIVFSRNIYDNVHGFIGITELEGKVIDSPFFQRLRRIRQLSLVDYVFPGALHNRFNHSLGVMHIADKMVVHLQEKGYLAGDRDLLRMTALLHDVGHYPLSHLVESVVKNHTKSKIRPDKIRVEAEGNENNEDDEKIDLRSNKVHCLNVDWHDSRNPELDFAHHERMASIVIRNSPLYDILTDDGDYDENKIRTMCQIIAGSYPDKSRNPRSLIIHSELDADRFDYLLRDSNQTGVIYGLFDMDQIIRHLEYIEDTGEEGEENCARLVVWDKATKAVEHYLMSKYFFYSTIITHKATVGFELMAKEVCEGLIERNLFMSYFDLVEKFSDSCNVDEYLTYDDNYFFNILNNVSRNPNIIDEIREPKYSSEFKHSNDFLLTLINKILIREPLKLVFEDKKLVKKDMHNSMPRFMKDRFKKSLSDCPRPIEDCWYITYDYNVPLTDISPHIIFDNKKDKSASTDETIRILYKADDDSEPEVKLLIGDESSIMSILRDYEFQIYRVYTKDEQYKSIIKKVYDS